MFSSNTSQVSNDVNYIEDVFSTHLYTGNGSTQTITNGIDLAGEGGLVWIKRRDTAASHALTDTARGSDNYLSTDTSAASISGGGVSFGTGFSITGSSSLTNGNGFTYASWTFREQPRFFDIVTWTGNGVAGRQISHDLGSVPGFLVVKRVDSTGGWPALHRNDGTNWLQLSLNSTNNGSSPSVNWFGDGTSFVAPTSTNFTVGANSDVNASGWTYVAYLFAHNAGGFGLTGTDNVISCGIATSTGSGTTTINLGYEPQWILIKGSNVAGYNWNMFDNMRGMGASGNTPRELNANLTNAEGNGGGLTITSTGFTLDGTYWGAVNLIYIAIRRGPMKTPTSGTSVFSAKTYSATTTSAQVTHDVTFDAEINANRDYSGGAKFLIVDSLRGINGVNLWTASTNLENSFPTYWSRKDQRTMYAPSAFDQWWASNSGTQGHISYGLVRAPGFFDEVCYTGTGSATTVNHNLGVAPELMIVKRRNSATYGDWYVYAASQGATKFLLLNLTDAVATNSGPWNNTAPTASVFTAGADLSINSTATYVAYLFASCPGVSKVGSFIGSTSPVNVDCGFTNGARFVMLKVATGTGDWFVFDTARGITASGDPYLVLNRTAAENDGGASGDLLDPLASGFTVNPDIMSNGATYIFLAIA